MNTIKFYGLNRFLKKNTNAILQATSESISDGICINGEFTLKLEKEIAKYCNRKHAVTLGSGTDSLFLALLSLGIVEGDEILLPAISFIATATAITRVGAIPVFVDVCTDNVLIDLKDAKNKITSKTKALLYVDLYGNLPEFNELENFAANYNLMLIEDAAQSFGSSRSNRIAGSMGDISTLSFDPTKPIGAFGTGGAILTDNNKLADFCRSARQNGKSVKSGKYNQFGLNSQISEMQASLILWQLENFNEQLETRQFLSKHYYNGLKNLPVKIIVQEQFNYIGNFHKFVIQLDTRNELQAFLKTRRIETRVHYCECLYEHPVLRMQSIPCLKSEKLTREVLSLPFYPELTIPEIDYIINCIKDFFKK